MTKRRDLDDLEAVKSIPRRYLSIARRGSVERRLEYWKEYVKPSPNKYALGYVIFGVIPGKIASLVPRYLCYYITMKTLELESRIWGNPSAPGKTFSRLSTSIKPA